MSKFLTPEIFKTNTIRITNFHVSRKIIFHSNTIANTVYVTPQPQLNFICINLIVSTSCLYLETLKF